jgi:2-keto-3-deoxy-L-rhamnonate aldolase RhmA
MVRPPTLERTMLYRYLEDGASGFLMPLVSDPEMAAAIVQAAKFPNRETFIITQVETLQAVANAEEIASIDGIDGLFIGPADLGLRIAAAPAGNQLTMEKAIQTVAEAAGKHNKIWGITAGSVDDIKRFRALGAQIVPWGGDFALMNVLKNGSSDLDTVPGA